MRLKASHSLISAYPACQASSPPTLLSTASVHEGLYFTVTFFWFVFVFALNFLFLKSTYDKESAYQCKRQGFDHWVGRSPRQGNGSPVFLPGKFHGQRSWQATVHGVAKSWTHLSDQNNNTCLLMVYILACGF